ncbi:MAG: SCP2 sterol-binding domain-containing protein [Candidatus Helarchaeota archaeon]
MVDTKRFAVKILMGAIAYASSQLAELDDSFKQKLAGIDAVIQWKVGDIKSYTVVKDQKINSKMDAEHDNPTYIITIDDMDIALEMFQGKLDGAKAIQDGKLKVEGDTNTALKQMFILEDLADYLRDLTGGG